MKKCRILVTKEHGQVLAGIVTLLPTRITSTATKGYETLMANLVSEPVKVHGQAITAEQNPALWFAALPSKYSGSYLRAQII